MGKLKILRTTPNAAWRLFVGWKVFSVLRFHQFSATCNTQITREQNRFVSVRHTKDDTGIIDIVGSDLRILYTQHFDGHPVDVQLLSE